MILKFSNKTLIIRRLLAVNVIVHMFLTMPIAFFYIEYKFNYKVNLDEKVSTLIVAIIISILTAFLIYSKFGLALNDKGETTNSKLLNER